MTPDPTPILPCPNLEDVLDSAEAFDPVLPGRVEAARAELAAIRSNAGPLMTATEPLLDDFRLKIAEETERTCRGVAFAGVPDDVLFATWMVEARDALVAARAELAALRARCAEWEAECQWLVEKMNRIVGAVRIDGASEILWRDVATIAAERRALSAPQPDAEERGAVE